MKKLRYIIGIVLCLAVSSCSDFLDNMPSDSLPAEEAITTITDLNNAVNGIGYLMSQDRMTYGSDFAIYADLRGEDFYAISNNNHAGPLSRYTITKYELIPSAAYTYYYRAIANVNKVLSVIDNVEYDESEAATFNDYKGQLYAWRAMLHFDLARMFCRIPTAADDVNAANSGLVLSTEVYEPGYVGTRSTLKETYDQIFADFATALPLLSQDKHDGYINYWAALALRSRAYLYNGQYQEALADADAVIASPLYRLYTRDNYTAVWGQEYTDESLFELKITMNYNSQRNSVGYYCDGDQGYGECAFVQTAPLYQYLASHPEDIRSAMIKDQSSNDMTTPGLYPSKYPGREGSLYVNNPKIIRLSEVYLIAAEAALQTGGDAASYINTLRENRIENYADVQSVTLDDILFERRIELFAENSMAFDYWRNRKSVDNFYVGVIDYNNTQAILPIPQDEIDLSSGLLEQNPGY